MKQRANCEQCINYYYDEDTDCFACAMDLDEDEMRRFIQDTFQNCPYFRLGDDYTIVRKQI